MKTRLIKFITKYFFSGSAKKETIVGKEKTQSLVKPAQAEKVLTSEEEVLATEKRIRAREKQKAYRKRKKAKKLEEVKNLEAAKQVVKPVRKRSKSNIPK